jgi:hypothetical protein
VYSARRRDCRACLLREQCQVNLLTIKPRQVSAVYWPLISIPVPVATPILGQLIPSADDPVLWCDWSRCWIRRNWLKVVRSQSMEVCIGKTPELDQSQTLATKVFTRSERAHWRFTWEQRLSRNARPATSPSVTITLHGLPASFAQTYGFDLLNVA